MNREAVLAALTELIQEFNLTQDDEHKISASAESDVLVGPGSDLDSLGTVNFLLVAEEKLAGPAGKPLSLLDEDFLLSFADEGMSIGAFIDHIEGA